MGLFDFIQKNFLGNGSTVTAMAWSLPGKWSKRAQLEQFNRYVYTIVSAFALDFAKSEFVVRKKLAKDWQDLPEHELTKLLESPNPQQSGFTFLELHATYMKLAGESFWYRVNGKITKKPKELYLLRPDLVDVKVAQDSVGTVKGYELRKINGEKITFEPEDVIHFKYPNPINPYRGMGVVEASMTYLQTENYASEWTKNSIYNSGRPSGIINLKGKLNDAQYKQLKKSFKQEYTGTKNTGKTLLLKGFDGIDWAKLGMDLEGVDLEKIKNITREDIMFMFRVSNTLMGITDDVNRANSKEMRGVWMENVIKPELDRTIDQLKHSLVKPLYGPLFDITYTDPNPESIEDRVEEWNVGHNKWLTTNMILQERNEILGTETPMIPGGDKIWIPLSMTPMDDKPYEPPKTTPAQEPAPKPPTEDDKPEEKPKKTIKKQTKQLSRYERGEVMRKSLYEQQERWEKPYQQAVNRVFKQQKEWILENNKKQIEGWLFDRIASNQLWRSVLFPITIELMKQQAKFMFDFTDDDTVQGELEITPQLRARIYERIDRFTGDVDDDTLAQIKESITEAITQGESVQSLRKRITEVYDSALADRSERIARTETIYASNEASQEAMTQLPSVVAKEWMANPGACEFCDAVNGKVVGVGERFYYMGQSIEGSSGAITVLDYEDVGHPPLHPNCRCTLLPVNMTEFREYRIAQVDNLVKLYESLDKRTRQAKDLLEEITKKQEEANVGDNKA